ncbi:hypothetical protein Syun_019301 [Stephania yunnanensis]|uniref:Uncharacterized protein n=1 Tax=Stephania yunnanensis TaxID=152371 RepID=A0AAP0ITZ3_9MAGN
MPILKVSSNGCGKRACYARTSTADVSGSGGQHTVIEKYNLIENWDSPYSMGIVGEVESKDLPRYRQQLGGCVGQRKKDNGVGSLGAQGVHELLIGATGWTIGQHHILNVGEFILGHLDAAQQGWQRSGRCMWLRDG